MNDNFYIYIQENPKTYGNQTFGLKGLKTSLRGEI